MIRQKLVHLRDLRSAKQHRLSAYLSVVLDVDDAPLEAGRKRSRLLLDLVDRLVLDRSLLNLVSLILKHRLRLPELPVSYLPGTQAHLVVGDRLRLSLHAELALEQLQEVGGLQRLLNLL